jgi:hypothetical protein
MSFYSLDDYNNLKFTTSYTLPTSINEIITKLASELSVSIESVNHVVYKKKHYKEIKDEDWKAKPFKTTIIANNKSESEKMIDDIRICMNKISKTNYGEQLNTIVKFIQPILKPVEQESPDTNTENKYKLAQIIFDISSTNKFFSELYADLYRDLINTFPVFQELLDSMLIHFTKTMENIKYVSPDDDYDKHCNYNNENDKRKASSTFLVNLMKRDVIQPEILINLTLEIIETMKTYMNGGNQHNEIEEIVENLFILITLGKEKYEYIYSWERVVEFIKNVSELKLKQSNISNRAIFKCIDIYQNICGLRK